MTSLASFLAASITASSACAGTAMLLPIANAAEAANSLSLRAGFNRPSSGTPVKMRGFAGISWRAADQPRDRAIAERRRHEQRVNARAAGHDDAHVLRPIGHADVIRIANLGKPARAAMVQPFDGAAGKTRERDAGTLEDCPADFRLADALARERSGVLGTDDEQRSGWKNDVVVPESRHGADELVQDLVSGLAAIGEDIVRSGRADHRHGAVRLGKARVHMERRPRARVLGFGDAGGEF